MGPIYIRTSKDLDPIQVLYFIYLFIFLIDKSFILYVDTYFVTPFILVLGPKALMQHYLSSLFQRAYSYPLPCKGHLLLV